MKSMSTMSMNSARQDGSPMKRLIVSLLLLLTLGWVEVSQAWTYVAASPVDASSDKTGAGSDSVTCTKPTGTADNDIMLAVTKQANTVSTEPSGWTLLASDADVGTGATFRLYRKIAASEGADYTWTWSTTGRAACSIFTFRDDFNTADPEDVVSNTSYETNNTTVRAAAVTAAAVNSPLVYIAYVNSSVGGTFTAPSAPCTFTEHFDSGNGDSRMYRTAASCVWTGSGSTGDVDGTIGTSSETKHAFLVVLNPAAAAGSTPRGLLLGVYP